MQDINKRVKNLYRLYVFLLGLAIFTGCWLFLLLTIPVLCRLYYLYKLKGVYEKYNRFQQLYRGEEGYV